MEANVQEREARRLVGFDLGHDHERAAVGTAPHDGDFTLRGSMVLGTAQDRVVRGARRDVARDATRVDHSIVVPLRAGSPSMR